MDDTNTPEPVDEAALDQTVGGLPVLMVIADRRDFLEPSAQAASCQNNLKQIGLAIHN